MPEDQTTTPSLAERPDELLAQFLASNPGAQRAAQALKAGAEVAVAFSDFPGDWRVYLTQAGAIGFEQATAQDPDFSLRIPPGALRALCSSGSADLGDLGIAFFEHIVAREQDRKIHVTVHSGLVKLTRRGWLGLLTQGGSKTLGWMARKGLRGPGAIVGALGRLKG